MIIIARLNNKQHIVLWIYHRAAITDHPFPVLQYAAIQNNPELSNLAAPPTISLSFAEVKKHLRNKPNVLFVWVCIFSIVS